MSEPITLLLTKLDGVRRSGPSSWMARCPCHEDSTPSLSVREAPDGRVLIHCFGGCGATDIVISLGLDLADLFPPRQQISYGPSRVHDHTIPRIAAADALRLLDQESFYVLLAADALACGCDLSVYRDGLSEASARIAEIRRLWEMQP